MWIDGWDASDTDAQDAHDVQDLVAKTLDRHGLEAGDVVLEVSAQLETEYFGEGTQLSGSGVYVERLDSYLDPYRVGSTRWGCLRRVAASDAENDRVLLFSLNIYVDRDSGERLETHL